MWPGRVFFFVVFSLISGFVMSLIRIDGCTAEGGLYDDDFVFVNDGWWKQWLFSGRLSEITDLIWKSFLNLLPPKEKKRIASHYVFRLLFSYALHLCESWRISAKLLCYLGSFPRTPFPLHFSRLVLNLSPAVVEMIDCTECGERKIFLFALLSLIQNLFLLDVPCVSKGFNTAQSCQPLLFTICLPCHKQFKIFFTFLTRPIELICFSSFLKKDTIHSIFHLDDCNKSKTF